jgi:hypothetical protein
MRIWNILKQSYDWCRGGCSEAKDHVEQLSKIKECILVFVLLWCCGRHIYGHDQGLFT